MTYNKTQFESICKTTCECCVLFQLKKTLQCKQQVTEITPASRKRSISSVHLQPNWKKCLCHVTECSENLTSFTTKSWEKFQKCSQTRQNHIWLTMMNYWKERPKGEYHRQCYQRYTNKGHLTRIEATSSNPSPSSAYLQNDAAET